MASSTQTVTETITGHLASVSYADLPPTAVEGVKRSLLDAIAVSLGAAAMEPATFPFVEEAKAAGSGICDIIGHSDKVSAPMAAFANGALAHSLDFEDAYDAAPMHPNAPLVPALLAIAQRFGPISGEQLITAMAVGCDLACRMGLCTITPAEAGGWYPPPIYAGFGAIAAAGKALNFTPDQFRDAFSLGLTQITMSGEIKYNPDSAIRAVREAFPAMAAVHSAQLARHGMKGFDLPFEGKSGFFRLYVNGDYSPGVLTSGLGEDFKCADISYKAWPCCRGTHAFIEGALELRAQISDLAQIERIELIGGAILEMLAYPVEGKQNPTVAIDAKFSLYYTAALALVRGRVTLDDFGARDLGDAEILSVSQKAIYINNGGTDAKDASSGTIRISMRNGDVLETHVAEPKGSLGNPISREDLIDKAVSCGARAPQPVDEGRMRQLADLIWSLEQRDNAAEAIFELIRPVD